MRQPSRPLREVNVSKRQLLATTGTFLAGGGVVSVLGSDPAAAAVNVSELNIPEETVSGKDTSVQTVTLQVGGNYQYSAPDADTLTFTLSVAPDRNGEYHVIDTLDESISTQNGSGSYDLNGEVLDHPQLDAATFSASTAETVTTEVPVRVSMIVSAGGEVVVESFAEGTAVVRLENTGIQASAQLTGSGEVAVAV